MSNFLTHSARVFRKIDADWTLSEGSQTPQMGGVECANLSDDCRVNALWLGNGVMTPRCCRIRVPKYEVTAVYINTHTRKIAPLGLEHRTPPNSPPNCKIYSIKGGTNVKFRRLVNP